jgi:hypothetical protein
LAVSDPIRAQFELDQEDYLGRIGALQKQYRKHPRVKELFLVALECVGVEVRTVDARDAAGGRGTPLS